MIRRVYAVSEEYNADLSLWTVEYEIHTGQRFVFRRKKEQICLVEDFKCNGHQVGMFQWVNNDVGDVAKEQKIERKTILNVLLEVCWRQGQKKERKKSVGHCDGYKWKWDVFEGWGSGYAKGKAGKCGMCCGNKYQSAHGWQKRSSKKVTKNAKEIVPKSGGTAKKMDDGAHVSANKLCQYLTLMVCWKSAQTVKKDRWQVCVVRTKSRHQANCCSNDEVMLSDSFWWLSADWRIVVVQNYSLTFKVCAWCC